MGKGPICFGTGLTTLKSSMSLILQQGEGQPTEKKKKKKRKEQQFITTQFILGSLYRHRSL